LKVKKNTSQESVGKLIEKTKNEDYETKVGYYNNFVLIMYYQKYSLKIRIFVVGMKVLSGENLLRFIDYGLFAEENFADLGQKRKNRKTFFP